MKKEERLKRRRSLKNTIDQYYAKEMLTTLLRNGFTEMEICTEFENMMKHISKEGEG